MGFYILFVQYVGKIIMLYKLLCACNVIECSCRTSYNIHNNVWSGFIYIFFVFPYNFFYCCCCCKDSLCPNPPQKRVYWSKSVSINIKLNTSVSTLWETFSIKTSKQIIRKLCLIIYHTVHYLYLNCTLHYLAHISVL